MWTQTLRLARIWLTSFYPGAQAELDPLKLCLAEEDQAALLNARDFEHFAQKKEDENLHKQEMLNIN